MAPFVPTSVDLRQVMDDGRVLFLPAGIDKSGALSVLAEVTAADPRVGSRDEFLHALHDRERVSSTGIGGGIAVPHAKLASIEGFVVSVGISRAGIPFEAKDGHPVQIVVMIAASEREREAYLRVLATVAARLKQPGVCEALLAAETPAAVVEALAG